VHPVTGDDARTKFLDHADGVTANSNPMSAPTIVEHVLVPMDGSEFALAAMPTARALAEQFHAELHTISVVSAGHEADRLARLGSAVLGVSVEDDRVRVVESANVTDEILRRAEELDECVVCLSTLGRGRLGGAAIGSVARELVQRSGRPLVALGPVGDMPDWNRSPAWPLPLSFARIVACVDGSEASEEVLPVASGWARALGMSLTILTVTEDAPPPLRPERRTSPYGDGGDAEAYIEGLVTRWGDAASEVTGQVVRDPIGPARGVQTHLAQEPAGLVALTSHARSGMKRIRLGATAANIVQLSPSPCLVVPLQS
jgi:nucleotide-binding universal stress UspA family protein